MRRVVNLIIISAGLLVPVCSGQSLLDQVNFQTGQFGGIHLIGVSVYSGYSTSAYPQGVLELNSLAGSLGGDWNYGATASLGWQHHGQNSDVSVLYSGSYGGMVRYSNLDGYSQSLSLSASRKLTPKWTFGLSASGSDSTIAQYLFQPSSLSVITQVPASFDDLAAAFAAGQYTNAQAASMLTGAPIMQTAARSLLLGNRVLSYSANANLAYAASARLQIHFASFAAAGQSRSGGQESVAPANYIMPMSLGGNAGMGFTYALSPRTQVGIDLGETRTVNHFQGVYTSSASASVGRKMGMHWFLSGHGGGTYNVVTQQTLGAPKTRQIIGGGSLGFQTGMHTLVASYDRSGSDTFGFAVGTITTMSGAWNWHQAGSRWGVFASYGEEQTRNAGFASLSGWQGSGGINLAFTPRTSLSAQYVYMNSAGSYLGTYTNIAVQSVRLSLGWSPQTVAGR